MTNAQSSQSAVERQVIAVLAADGPLTGAELVQATDIPSLGLWRTCQGSASIGSVLVGRRYLRLDRAVEGYARLSPSIRREFLTYTVLGTQDQLEQTRARAAQLTADADRISREKAGVAREAMAEVMAALGLHRHDGDKITFMIGGDVTYGMAHTVPRPEISTGLLIRGSDLDIICVVTDDFPRATMRALDQAIYRRKHYLMVHPDHHEEVDYVIKRRSVVGEQLAFDTFEHCVASKILDEAEQLCGSTELFEQLKQQVADSGVHEKIEQLTERAAGERATSERFLLASNNVELTGEHYNLFFTREEGDEIY